ncbi:hypothetical protein NEOLEDRAFT_537057 [Neolentinus lepideus HHB14362 ss-1]|uniref:Uncharacterized protein n=1 Tax=Neolentinus lepideus HHB14362 ss-1 TaxID=1314782 RepID=A0A165RB31_9AGAM|nr:hypothetical protein NEOLEDRAFT_537057 [Neolentinus lepideus HHB14362 ss-1]
MDIASIANEAASLNNNGEVNGSTGLLKRKRDSLAPLQLPDPVGDVKTGAADANGTAAPASKKPRKSKGNGRTKITVKPDPDAVSEAGSSGSVASVAAQVLASSSRVPSRASSVASEPSPTVPKSSGFKIRIKPLQQQTDRVFHHHGRKPKITPLPSITRSRPKLQRQRKSQKQPKAEAQAETEDAHLSQPSSKVQLTPKTEILSSAKPTPEAESSPMPKSESKPELLPSRPTPPFDVESPSLPPAPPTSPVKKPEPSQPAVLEADSAPQSPSLKSPESQYSSPVTRSHCLYHVISIPRKEDGPRITFMVPGCSLLDKDLITEEAIIDIREATREDEGRAVHDIETLGFDDDLLVVLKALVSGEQHSIFYLPSASEDPSFLNNNRQHFSEASNKGGSSQSTPVSARRKRAPRESVNGGSADHNGRSHTREAASNPASVDGDVVDSRNGSPSGTAESRSEGSSPDSRTADSFGEEDELDQSRLPPKKRKYLSHEGSLTSRPHDAADNDQGPSASASGSHHRDGFEPQLKSVASHRLKPRRSKRLSVDAAAYKPDESSPDDEQEQSTTRRHKRKRLSGRRSTKRGHDTANGVDDSGDRSVKKSRVEEVVSSGKNSDAGSPSS